MKQNILYNFLLVLFSFLGLKLIIFIGLNNITDYLPITYCEDGEDNLSDLSSIKSITDSISKVANNRADFRHIIDASPGLLSILEGIRSIAQNTIFGYEAYHAASFVPHPYGKVTVFLGSFEFLTATQQIAHVMMNRHNSSIMNIKSTIENDTSNKVMESLKVSSENLDQDKVMESLKVPLENLDQDKNSDFSSDIFINNSFESSDLNFIVSSVIETDDLNVILSGIILYALTGLYVLISLGLGIISREFKLEEKDWIKSKPILLKLATLGKHSSRTILLLLYLLIFLCLLGILLTSIYLKSQL
jgi:hypothetical protein